MPLRIVLDTNVLVSALKSPHGAPAQLLRHALTGDPAIVIDERIFAEYREVAARQRFGFAPADVERVLSALRERAEHVTARPLRIVLPDSGDLPFLEVAVAARVSALVTGNPRHFSPVAGRHRVPVRSPREILEELGGFG
ncbi:MAG: putative toxin-antitoxin system toxin component, PIN family [Gemmatimonadota bacterium]